MIADTLYFQYLNERSAVEIIETQQSFITYKIVGKECFLMDTYVSKEARQSGCFKSLFSQLEKTALEKGCEFIAANIFLGDNNFNTNLRVALASGFNLTNADREFVVVIKKLKMGSSNV